MSRRYQSNGARYDDEVDDDSASKIPDNDDESQNETDASLSKDYVKVSSRPYILKILRKQGDKSVLFADQVMKFTGSGKMKRRILLLSDFALYFFDPNTDTLKRRIALAAVEKVCLSELSDNFLAIIIPTEYDILIASTRKREIVNALTEATKSASDYELDVFYSNRFEYNVAADLVKEVHSEEVEGGVKTSFVRIQMTS